MNQPDRPPLDVDAAAPEPIRKPSRWALSNWPVRWKMFAIVLVPLLLVATFGGLRVYSAMAENTELRRAAERAEVIPPVVDYMAALEEAMVAATAGRETEAALTRFDEAKVDLQQRADDAQTVSDVRAAVDTLIDGGQDLINKVMTNVVDLRQRVTAYAPLLLTAETAITGSAREDAPGVQRQAEALSRAVGARGQMTMQEMSVTSGGYLPEPELRTSLITLAGTEPSTINGMIAYLGNDSQQAATLRAEMVRRMSMMSDPAVPLAGNPELLGSQQITRQVADAMVADLATTIPTEVQRAADEQRTAAIRDTVLVVLATLLAGVVVLLVARSLVRPLRTLRDSALQVAHDDLARELEQVRETGELPDVAPIPVHTTEEIGQVAHAVDELHEQAVSLASEQTRLQLQISDMFETLSRRSRSLVDQQLALIDQLERNEEDPQRLQNLFRLDHLAARMRRNGANLLVLAGAKVPRDQAAPVPVASLINAAASEVEDYTRVVTTAVPDSEIRGPVAGDLVHLLAELLDNALRYSPPTAPVRVSAGHTDTGGLVIEINDAGLGMSESDLRMANTRLESGGEVDAYTARHMGLFVVGRLAAQHDLRVRLRSTVPGDPGSGTTAGVYVPAGLLAGSDYPPAPRPAPPMASPADEPVGHAPLGAAVAAPVDAGFDDRFDTGFDNEQTEPQRTADPDDVPIGLLPQRAPGASGITELPGSLAEPSPADPAEAAEPVEAAEPTSWPQAWPDDTMPSRAPEPGPVVEPAATPDVEAAGVTEPRPVPTDTSAFFAARAQAPTEPSPPELPERAPTPPEAEPVGRHAASDEASATSGDGDAIYQKMLSEWLIDPTELGRSSDLNWESVWDHGWSKAAEAEDTPVRQHTAEGLPVREPGARLVPGGRDSVLDVRNGDHRDAGEHREDERVPSAAESDTQSVPLRDPEAVRASISNHFGGVQAGRLHARETRGTDDE